jgi:two-component sensor histidine kinase
MALSRSHDLLVSDDWKGATIFELLLAQAKPFGNEDRISMSGPSITLSPNSVQYLGIAFHELATNSAKYGVLSGNNGSISVDWTVVNLNDQRMFTLTWKEVDGPEVESIAKSGFGSVVLNRVTPQAISGKGELTHSSKGIVWNLKAPLLSVEASLNNTEDLGSEG